MLIKKATRKSAKPVDKLAPNKAHIIGRLLTFVDMLGALLFHHRTYLISASDAYPPVTGSQAPAARRR
jgi:hypothetical protein